MKIAVIGGGPAGCAATYTLNRRGHQVSLFEASDHLGGRTSQVRQDGFNLATGALFLMGGIYPRTMALLREMGCADQLVRWRGLTQLADRDGSRHQVRFDSLASFFRLPLLDVGDRIRLARAGLKLYLSPGPANPFDGAALARHDHGDNLEEWSLRQLGPHSYEYVVRPIMDFLYAVPASWLSTPFPLAIIQQAHKLGLSVPPGGIGQVSEWFVEHSPNAQLRLSSPVAAITRQAGRYRVGTQDGTHDFDGVVLATPSFAAADILGGLISDDVATRLRETPYTDYAHVALGYRRSPWPDYPVDMVLPVGAGETRAIGALVLHSRRHPGSVPSGGELVGVYFNTPPLAQMSDEDIRRAALEGTRKAFGAAPDPDFIRLFRYDRGLTIARPGHYGRLDAVHAQLPAGLVLAGDYFSQAGVEAAVFSGEKAALALHAGLQSPARAA